MFNLQEGILEMNSLDLITGATYSTLSTYDSNNAPIIYVEGSKQRLCCFLYIASVIPSMGVPGVALPAGSLCFGEVPESFDWPLLRSSVAIKRLGRDLISCARYDCLQSGK